MYFSSPALSRFAFIDLKKYVNLSITCISISCEFSTLVGIVIFALFKDSNISPCAIISVVHSYPPLSFTLNEKFLMFPIKPS